MRKVIGFVGLTIFCAMFSGCSASQQNADTCFALQSGMCAATYTPIKDYVDLAKCVDSAALMCGVANPPTPVPPAQMMGQYHK